MRTNRSRVNRAGSGALKWFKTESRYVAYPTATAQSVRYASVHLLCARMNTDITPHKAFELWAWLVKWEGWFAVSGVADSKQAAADQATEAWWKAVDSEPPRNVDLEATMIAARVLMRPPPNSLFAEDPEFLRKVLWHLSTIYRQEIKRGEEPAPVKQLMGRLSEELYRRRLKAGAVRG